MKNMSTEYGARYTNNSTIATGDSFPPVILTGWNIPTPTTPAFPLMLKDWDEYRFRKPPPKNTNVDKKVKRAGWSPQFFEK